MNRKEASFILANIDRRVCDDELNEALDVAIKALEHEPCDDCISRQAVEKITWEEPSYTDPFNVLTEVREKVRALPPITPQPKTGHWIFDDECKEHGHCSRYRYGSVDLVDGEPHNFCRKCGAWMVEPQERSDKE